MFFLFNTKPDNIEEAKNNVAYMNNNTKTLPTLRLTSTNPRLLKGQYQYLNTVNKKNLNRKQILKKNEDYYISFNN